MLQAHAVMEPKLKIVCTWMVVGLFFSMIIVPSHATFVDRTIAASTQSSTLDKYDYKRFPEVQRECQSIISLASELQYDTGWTSSIERELSFRYGDWEQDSNGSKTLVPMPEHSATAIPYHVVSFSLLNVEQDRQFPSVVKVAGSLRMMITSKTYVPWGRSFSFSTDDASQFEFMLGFSSLNILFEGIYAESEVDGGRRIMCMLGKTSIPSTKSDSDSSNAKDLQNRWGTGRDQFSLTQDDKILMVLRYPKSFGLARRSIHGEITSLHDQKNSLYFDKIKLFSQLSVYSNYQFGSEELISKTCNPHLHQGNSLSSEIAVDKASQVCELLRSFGSGAFSIVPNWKCNSTAEYCNKLGPFKPPKVVGETNRTNEERMNIKLYMQDVRCEAQPAQGKVSSARVSAVFRVIHSMAERISRRRSSLDNTTLSAEGTWNSDGGQLCMVGCLGRDGKKCDSRVLINFAVTFSISQRNVISGTISNSNASGANSYYPLSFERVVLPREFPEFGYLSVHVSYKYTKIEMAGSLLERNEPFDFNALIKKSLLRYPKVEGDEGRALGLSNLAADLTFNARVVSSSLTSTRIQMDIYTVGPLFRHFWYMTSAAEPDEQRPAKTASTEKELLLNVSAMFTVSGNKEHFTNISKLYLEGLYNPADGKMYLIGCREARAPQKVLFDSFDLENGLDCLIEVKIEYPPVTAKWLVSPSIKIFVSSQRNDDDLLRFSPIELQTSPIRYHKQLEDIICQRTMEEVLQVLVLSMAIACIFSQLNFIGKDPSSVPFISIVATGVLALGYSIPLISGAEALFFGGKSKSHSASLYDLQNYQSSHVIDYFMKILFLAAFLLTVRIMHKVWKSRRRLLARMPSEPRRVPNDRWVLVACLGIHLVGILAVVSINTTSQRCNPSGMYCNSRGWGVELEEYLGMVQDFFLLPQVIGNVLWQLNGKPLRKIYYMGITILRILPHAYDYMVSPSVDPYVVEEDLEFLNPNMDFYGKYGDVAIPIIASLLALIVFCQQRWSCQKLYRSLGLGRVQILPMGSRAYDRLPTASHEAELVGLNENKNQRGSEGEHEG